MGVMDLKIIEGLSHKLNVCIHYLTLTSKFFVDYSSLAIKDELNLRVVIAINSEAIVFSGGCK